MWFSLLASDFSELQFPPSVKKRGRCPKYRQRLYQKRRPQVWEKRNTLDKDRARLSLLLHDDAVNEVSNGSRRAKRGDLLASLSPVLIDSRVCLEEVKIYFLPEAWRIIKKDKGQHWGMNFFPSVLYVTILDLHGNQQGPGGPSVIIVFTGSITIVSI